jgi:hypothetical protein
MRTFHIGGAASAWPQQSFVDVEARYDGTMQARQPQTVVRGARRAVPRDGPQLPRSSLSTRSGREREQLQGSLYGAQLKFDEGETVEGRPDALAEWDPHTDPDPDRASAGVLHYEDIIEGVSREAK